MPGAKSDAGTQHSFWLRNEEWDLVVQRAQEQGLTRNGMLRRMITDWSPPEG